MDFIPHFSPKTVFFEEKVKNGNIGEFDGICYKMSFLYVLWSRKAKNPGLKIEQTEKKTSFFQRVGVNLGIFLLNYADF